MTPARKNTFSTPGSTANRRAKEPMPGRALGSTIVMKRVKKLAPRLAAPSSSVRRSLLAQIAATARTMKGSVNTTCPTTMNAALMRNRVKPP